jgi:hypothetical protein
MTYRGRPGARHLERSPLQQQVTRIHRQAALPLPTTVPELNAQLAEIVVHESGCRWTTTRRTPMRPDETLAQAERRNCTCTAVPHRQHLFDLITRTGTAAPGSTR